QYLPLRAPGGHRGEQTRGRNAGESEEDKGRTSSPAGTRQGSMNDHGHSIRSSVGPPAENVSPPSPTCLIASLMTATPARPSSSAPERSRYRQGLVAASSPPVRARWPRR